MKTYRQLVEILNERMRKNMGKALVSFFFMSVLEGLIMSVFSIPAMALMSVDGSTDGSIVSLVFSLISGLFSCVCRKFRKKFFCRLPF